MADPVTQIASDLLKRRSTRIARAVSLRISGVDALGRSFDEHTWTSIISCHGGRYPSKYYVFGSEWVMLEVRCGEPGRAQRVRGRVAWVQRPLATGDPLHFGVELEVAGNFWGIAGCPQDWFPFPDTRRADVASESASPERSAPWSKAAMLRNVDARASERKSRSRQDSENSSGLPVRF